MEKITIEAFVNAPIEKVWKYWTEPEHVKQWNNASPDWHTPKAENDLRVGGKFVYHMAAKDGSFAFDFGGTYNEVKTNELITYTMDDHRHVINKFSADEDGVEIVTTFDAEQENSLDMQRQGWQSILDNFKKYTENN